MCFIDLDLKLLECFNLQIHLLICWLGDQTSQDEEELLKLEKIADEIEAEEAVSNIPQAISPIVDDAASLAPLVGSARAVTVVKEENQKLSSDAAQSLQLIKDIKKASLAAPSSSKPKATPQSMPQLVGSQPKIRCQCCLATYQCCCQIKCQLGSVKC